MLLKPTVPFVGKNKVSNVFENRKQGYMSPACTSCSDKIICPAHNLDNKISILICGERQQTAPKKSPATEKYFLFEWYVVHTGTQELEPCREGGGGGGGALTWINFCWICAAALSEPLPSPVKMFCSSRQHSRSSRQQMPLRSPWLIEGS